MLLRSIGRSQLLVDSIGLNCVIQESQRRQGFIKSVGCWSLEGSNTWGRLGLKGLLLFVYSNLFSSGSIYRLKGGGEVSSRVLQFLFNNTSQCYHVFAFFYPTLLAFILLLLFFEYDLEQFYHLFARTYSYSTLNLSYSKSNQVIIFNWGSKQALVFIHKSEFSQIIPNAPRNVN